ARSRADLPPLESRQRRAIVAQRAGGARVLAGWKVGRDSRLCGGFWGRPLDDRGGHAPRCAGAGHHAIAARAAPIAAGGVLWRTVDRRAAPGVWRPCGADQMTPSV